MSVGTKQTTTGQQFTSHIGTPEFGGGGDGVAAVVAVVAKTVVESAEAGRNFFASALYAFLY